MKKLTVYLLTAAAALLAGCGQAGKSADGGEFFSGMLYYDQADGYLFRDCATSLTMELSGGKTFERTVERYISLTEGSGEILVEFMGSVARLPEGIVPGSQTLTITIDSLTALTASGQCLSEFQLPGIYELRPGHDAPAKAVLRLRPGYTYTKTVYADDGSATEYSGNWHRAARLELVLDQLLPETGQDLFQIMPSEDALTRNSRSGESAVFRKVYL